MSTKVPWLYAQNIIGEEDVRCDPSYNFQLFLQIYKDFCPQIEWKQPPLSAYKKTLNSHLPEGCKK